MQLVVVFEETAELRRLQDNAISRRRVEQLGLVGWIMQRCFVNAGLKLREKKKKETAERSVRQRTDIKRHVADLFATEDINPWSTISTRVHVRAPRHAS